MVSSDQRERGPKGDKKLIYFRPEPWSAQYHTKAGCEFIDLLDQLLIDFRVKLIPRSKEQSLFFWAIDKTRARHRRINQKLRGDHR